MLLAKRTHIANTHKHTLNLDTDYVMLRIIKDFVRTKETEQFVRQQLQQYIRTYGYGLTLKSSETKRERERENSFEPYGLV